MNGMICQGREAGLLQAQAWIDSNQLGDVAKAKWFVQKILKSWKCLQLLRKRG